MYWLLRMAQWVRHPPSKRQVQIAAVVLAIIVVIVVSDRLGVWPDWARLSRPPKSPVGY